MILELCIEVVDEREAVVMERAFKSSATLALDRDVIFSSWCRKETEDEEASIRLEKQNHIRRQNADS